MAKSTRRNRWGSNCAASIYPNLSRWDRSTTPSTASILRNPSSLFQRRAKDTQDSKSLSSILNKHNDTPCSNHRNAKRWNYDHSPSQFIRKNREQNQPRDTANKLRRDDGISHVELIAVKLSIFRDCMCLLYETGIYDRTGVDFLYLGLTAAGECRRHEEVAGKEDKQRNEEPFSTDEHYRKDLETTLVSHLAQKFLSLHLSLSIISTTTNESSN